MNPNTLPINTAPQRASTTAWDLVTRIAQTDGIAAHPHLRRLTEVNPPQRDLADAIHALCAVHGRHPGLADEAVGRDVQPAARSWLAAATRAFGLERAYLAQLTSVAGPLPSTPGQSESEAAVAAQRHSFEMLARSERTGCASGAIAALLIDWLSIRRVLDKAADRFGAAVAESALPSEGETAQIVATLGASPATERALGFGAQQLFAQHRGLWDLLEARASARDRS